MDISVLGPFDVRRDGVAITPTAGKVRQVFAMLAIRAGQLVTVPALLEELWGADPPLTATSTMQTYILKLRRHIDRDGSGKDILMTRHGGYLLNLPATAVDVNRYQELAVAGEHALVTGDYHSASDLLGTALGMWRGPALVDVPIGARLGIEVTWLEQSRLSVVESRIEVELRLGRHHELLVELAELVSRYPMHERLCMQYMTALAVCGLKWRALEVFWALRGSLVQKLGVEPSFQVQQLQRAILNSDTELDVMAVGRQSA
jgi:SARP family transcriptional regulator, regulator of embCAB operon